MEDIFDLQHDITANIASALSVVVDVENGTREAHAPTANLDAYEKFTRGRNHFYLYANKDENRTARDFYQSAVDLDPGFASAYAMLGWTHAFDAMNGWSADREQSLDSAMYFANKAIALDADQPIAYFVRGLAYRERKEYIKAMVDAEKAIELNPSYANGHLLLSSLLYYGGRPEEGLAMIERSMRLNPHHPYNYSFHLGQAYFVLKRYHEAIAALRDAAASYPSSERLHVWLAASYAYTGNMDEANWEADQIMAINPDFSLERVEAVYPFIDEADRDHVIEGLRMAGLSR
jgi:adenylate cyclase